MHFLDLLGIRKSLPSQTLLLVVQKSLETGEVLIVDASSIVAMTGAIDLQLKHSNPMRRVVFGVSQNTTIFPFAPFVIIIM